MLLVVMLNGCEQQRLQKPDVLRIAVAANFAPTLEQLVAAYNQDRNPPLQVHTMVGSSGLLAAQLLSGAPYDLMFAADMKRPAALVKAGVAVAQAQTYAYGRLALWAPKHGFKDARKRLLEGSYTHLAIANPDLAPYGAASQQVLERLNSWGSIQNRLVRGENVGQVYRYVITERVDMGFVALSQVITQERVAEDEALWTVPASMHSPIEQQAVVLNGKNVELAEAFLAFCLGQSGRAIIKQAGYDLPTVE